ncbi:MAG: hypothetical protein K0R51_1428 [Cytophagaceae bacterium]|jgi:hypothetical protein|nr:hypothetical protein [Cytophagaceae bacterium]
MRIKWFIIGILFAIAEATASVPIAHLNDGWLVFDNSYKSFVPYIPLQESPKVLYYSLKPSKYQGDTLQFVSQKGICLYFNYRLVYQNTNRGETLIKIPISKLSTGITSDSVILAFYKPDGLLVTGLKAQIITQGKITPRVASSQPFDFLDIKLRKVGAWDNVLLFSVLAVLLLLIISKVIFPDDVSFLQLIGMNYTSKVTTASGFLSGILIVKILINSVCISTFIYFILHSGVNADNIFAQGEANHISYWYIMFWAIFVHILKFTYNYLCANFSHTTHLLQIQNGMFVNLFYIANLFLLAVLIASNLSPSISKWLVSQSGQIIVFYLITPVFFLVLNIIKRSGLRNVYLFSYICTAEILPLLVALKFLT